MPPSIAAALPALLGTVVAGVVAHELSHLLALRAAGVRCRVELLPGRAAPDGLRAGVGGPLATVTPVRVPEGLEPWQLRVAAMMPLCLVAPFGLVALGVAPDPFAVGDPSLELATIAWLGCSLPSPQDFSLLWHPERAIATHRLRAGVDSRQCVDSRH